MRYSCFIKSIFFPLLPFLLLQILQFLTIALHIIVYLASSLNSFILYSSVLYLHVSILLLLCIFVPKSFDSHISLHFHCYAFLQSQRSSALLYNNISFQIFIFLFCNYLSLLSIENPHIVDVNFQEASARDRAVMIELIRWNPQQASTGQSQTRGSDLLLSVHHPRQRALQPNWGFGRRDL